jgi:acetylornithine deacetylase/succinyl-diaminopimelate desuccinylase-like protein
VGADPSPTTIARASTAFPPPALVRVRACGRATCRRGSATGPGGWRRCSTRSSACRPLGIPAFAYGGGRLDISHGPAEYIDEAAMRRCAAVYALFAGTVSPG